jgi:DNA gyrase/topoisomerase IV subunit A
MISAKTAQNRIEKLDKHHKKLKNKLKETPIFKGYSTDDIRNIMVGKAEYYEGIQKNLFGNYPIEVKVFDVYGKYRNKYSYKTTARRHTAEEFEEFNEKDIKRLIKKHNRKLTRHNIWKAKRELQGYEKEIKKLKEKDREIKKYNAKIYEKLHRITEIKWELTKKKKQAELKAGKDATVVIDFRGLPATRFNGEASGSLVFLSQFMDKKEFKIARKNKRIEVISGDFKSAINNCNFRKDPPDINKCLNCNKELDYNIIGFNKKIGRKSEGNWLCLDCLDFDEEYFLKTVESYKSRGCKMFV